MRPLCLTLVLLSLLGCPRAPQAGHESTAAPAKAGTTSALLPPRATSLSPKKAKKPRKKIVTRQAVAGQGPIAPDDVVSAAAIQLEEPRNAVLEHASDVDAFTIWLPPGYPLEVEAHGYGEVHLRLQAPDGSFLTEGSRSVSHVTHDHGVYTLWASASVGQGLHYTLVAR